jgi:hypothetical protein
MMERVADASPFEAKPAHENCGLVTTTAWRQLTVANMRMQGITQTLPLHPPHHQDAAGGIVTTHEPGASRTSRAELSNRRRRFKLRILFQSVNILHSRKLCSTTSSCLVW